MEHWESLLTGLLGASGGAALAAAAARALMREEIEKIAKALIAEERSLIHERFATRVDVLRLEAKIDVLIARLGGV